MPSAPQRLRARKPPWRAALPRPAPVEYPESDGKPMAESEVHLRAMFDLWSILDTRYAHREDVHVGGNLMMYYVRGNKSLSVSPDVFVAFGPSRDPLRDVWLAWEEGKFADFVLEVASKTTHGDDEVPKRLLYQRLGVTEYWQHDPTGRYIDPLKGHRLNDRGIYERIPLATTPEGMPYGESRLLALHLCLDAGRLRLFDPATGEFLLSYEEERRAREAAEAEVEELKRQLARRPDPRPRRADGPSEGRHPAFPPKPPKTPPLTTPPKLVALTTPHVIADSRQEGRA